MRSAGLILSILLMASNSWAQQVAMGVSPGFLVAHRADLKNIETHMMGFEFQYEQRSNADWAAYYKEPIWGLGLSYFHFGGEHTKGAISAQANLQMSLAKMGRSTLKFRLGPGVGYVLKVFDPFENRRNQAIGSHWNAFMQTAFLMEHPVKKGNINYGIGISHFSNAAFKMPNLGYNLPSFFFRYSYPLGQEPNEGKTAKPQPIKSKFEPNSHYSAALIYGRKERNFANPVGFNNKGVQLRWLRQYSFIAAWRIGMDAVLDKTYKYSENNQVDLGSISLGDQLEIGIAAGHEWAVGELRFLIEAGAYLNRPADLKKPLYQRMGFNYNLTDNWALMGNLKFHRGVADYLETGIIYQWKK